MTSCDVPASPGGLAAPRRVSSCTALVGVLLAGGVLAGCSAGRQREVSLLDVRVLIDGQPAQDVRVTLRTDEGLDGPFELVGVTDQSGIAAMSLAEGSQLPAATEVKLRATVESLGDWAIREPWCDPQRSPLELTWNGTDASLEIQLPRKAVRSL